MKKFHIYVISCLIILSNIVTAQDSFSEGKDLLLMTLEDYKKDIFVMTLKDYKQKGNTSCPPVPVYFEAILNRLIPGKIFSNEELKELIGSKYVAFYLGGVSDGSAKEVNENWVLGTYSPLEAYYSSEMKRIVLGKILTKKEEKGNKYNDFPVVCGNPERVVNTSIIDKIKFYTSFDELTRQYNLIGAQNKLAYAYLHGEYGLDKDYLKYEKWTRKAAENGDSRAQYFLGRLYFSGVKGIKQDIPKAEKWFRKAAEQGDSDAQEFYALLKNLERNN